MSGGQAFTCHRLWVSALMCSILYSPATETLVADRTAHPAQADGHFGLPPFPTPTIVFPRLQPHVRISNLPEALALFFCLLAGCRSLWHVPPPVRVCVGQAGHLRRAGRLPGHRRVGAAGLRPKVSTLRSAGRALESGEGGYLWAVECGVGEGGLMRPTRNGSIPAAQSPRRRVVHLPPYLAP